MTADASPSGFLARAAARARQGVAVLRDEYRRGLAGDDSPVERLGPTATEVLSGWFARLGETDPERPTDHSDASVDHVGDDDAAGQVAGLLERADWAQVRVATGQSAVRERMRQLADRVDWQQTRPVAAKVATALIAAAAAGELGGLEGLSGLAVARTIANQGGLADAVAKRLRQQHDPARGGLGDFIDTTATESSAGDDRFGVNLADLTRANEDPGDSPS